MPESWRNILERTAANLSIELDQNPHPGLRPQYAGWPSPRPAAPEPYFFEESRYLLACELRKVPRQLPGRVPVPARPGRHPARVQKPAIARAPRPAAQETQVREAAPGRLGSLRDLAALTSSVAIVVLTGYAIFNLLH
jgi:hypothetical protein